MCIVFRVSWLLVFVVSGKQSAETAQRIFSTLSSDFYVDRVGDRSCLLNPNASGLAASSQAADLSSKLSSGVVQSFKDRCALYDTEIRRLDTVRSDEFRELFLVKESLALMYQMMQMPSEALVQYEELEALMAFAPVTIKEFGGWPILDSVSYFLSRENPITAYTSSAVERVTENIGVEPTSYGCSSFAWSCQEGFNLIVCSKL